MSEQPLYHVDVYLQVLNLNTSQTEYKIDSFYLSMVNVHVLIYMPIIDLKLIQIFEYKFEK